MSILLAIDSGLRTGLAAYGRDGRLIWYRSQHFAARSVLKKAVYGILNDTPVVRLVIEGGGDLTEIWIKEAEKRVIPVRQISAETWRSELLFKRERRHGKLAKHHAGRLAREVIDWSGAPRPTSLRHDAAEAILAGFWGVLHYGFLEKVPPELSGVFSRRQVAGSGYE